MTDSPANSPNSSIASKHGIDRLKAALSELPRWQKVLLIVSALCIACGIGLTAFEASSPTEDKQIGASKAPLDPSAKGGSQFAPTGPGTTPTYPGGNQQGPAEAEPDKTWSPVFLKLGFGFFVGFSMGFALRVFLSTALAFCGFFCIGLFALGQGGLVTVEWEAMGSLFDQFATTVGEQFQNLHAFLSGALPSAGLGTFGLYAGLRRR